MEDKEVGQLSFLYVQNVTKLGYEKIFSDLLEWHDKRKETRVIPLDEIFRHARHKCHLPVFFILIKCLQRVWHHVNESILIKLE